MGEFPVLVYDGDCAFCERCANWARRRLPVAVAVKPWQSIEDLSVYGLTERDVRESAWWVMASDAKHGGVDSAAMAFQGIGGVWALVGRALQLPVIHSVGQVVYRLIATNRHRMPGGTDSCRPDGEADKTD